MLKKLIVVLLLVNTMAFAMNEQQSTPIPQGTNINTAGTTVNTERVFMNSTGQNTYHTHQRPTFVAQQVSDNPIYNAAGIVAKSALEGAVQGVFQGTMQGIGGAIAQRLMATLNEPADEKDARTLLSKNQQITNLSSLRDEVNKFDSQAEFDEELIAIAYNLRIKLGHALLAFIQRQKNEEICIVTPLLHKVESEVNAFAKDTKGIDDKELITLRKQIQKTYGLLLYKQIQFEKESSKPAIVIPVR